MPSDLAAAGCGVVRREYDVLDTAIFKEQTLTTMDDSGQVRGFAGIVGQLDTIARLKTFADLYRNKNKPIGHVLLVGEEGMGKRTLARALAEEHGLKLREVLASKIERPVDLIEHLVDLKQSEVLLLSDLDRLAAPAADVLAGVLETFELEVVVGKGPAARPTSLAIKPFTCIATVRREKDCPSQLRKSFLLTLTIQPYSPSDIESLVDKLTIANGISVEPAVRTLLATLAHGDPAQTEVLIKRLALKGVQSINEQEAIETLSLFGLRSVGTGGGQVPGDVATLSGTDFERLITTLFQQMGFTAEMTKASGDGGIDIEAVLDRPIVGGRYLIQCKRLAPDTLVGSPIVREFYGALIADRKAVKGILITTSGFTIQAQEFARDLPLELIEGSTLQSLLEEYLKPDPGRRR